MCSILILPESPCLIIGTLPTTTWTLAIIIHDCQVIKVAKFDCIAYIVCIIKENYKNHY